MPVRSARRHAMITKEGAGRGTGCYTRAMKMLVWASLAAACLTGCGSDAPKCGVTSPVLAVSPASATADHSAASPGNQQQFVATSAPGEEPGCATPQNIARLTPNWTVSDPLHVKISSAADSSNGLATCLGPTLGAATLTASIAGGSSPTHLTASLTCK